MKSRRILIILCLVIKSIYLCWDELPSDRLVTALSLYYDQTIIPLSYLPDETLYQEIFHRLPSKAQSFFWNHAKFVERFRGISPNVILFPSFYNQPEQASTIKDMLTKLAAMFDSHTYDKTISPLLLSNMSYALGFFHGCTNILNERSNVAIVPVSNNDVIGKSLYPCAPDRRLADILASWLAIETIQLSLPDLETSHPLEILWARERLAEELSGFRTAMYRLAVNLREMTKESSDINSIRSEAVFLVKTHVLPAVQSLQTAVKLHKRSFARRLVVRSLDAFKIIVKYCCAPDPTKIAELASSAVSGVIDFSQYCDEIAKLNNKNAISYLAKLPEQFVRMKK
ncbi:MAG: hypothetical protein MUP16_10970 [Sedimentisphaerales bacterium]|nr:hypothetical protein [Sedimentisphaerales bacterium]